MAVQLRDVSVRNSILMLWDMSRRHESNRHGDFSIADAFPELKSLDYGVFALTIWQHPLDKCWYVKEVGTHFELARFAVEQRSYVALNSLKVGKTPVYGVKDELTDAFALEFIMHMNVLRAEFEAEHLEQPVCTVFDQSGQPCETHLPESFTRSVYRLVPTDSVLSSGLRPLTRVEREKDKATTSRLIRRTIQRHFFGENTAHKVRLAFNRNRPVCKGVTRYYFDTTIELRRFENFPPRVEISVDSDKNC